MAYDHLFIDGPRDRLFIKAHDPDQFTDTFREKHSRDYLYKEQFYFDHLRSVGYSAIPERTELIDGTILAMDALRIEDNWLWRAPKNELFDTYVTDVLNAFDSLATVKPPETSYHQDINPTYPTLWIEGWNDLSNTKVKAVREKIGLFMRQFPIHSHGYALDLSRSILELRDASLAYTPPTEYVVSHNDARQSNIAWHPKKGVKIVDWSWADQAPKGADATMFLIDLAKSGHDVSKYLNNYFVVDHAKTLIGFWLAHSLWETRDGSSTVRMHQIASAVYAFKLINDVYED
jgi:hypothetical protein